MAVLGTTNNYIGGSPVSVGNPYPSADTVRLYTQLGQMFCATTGKQANGAAGNFPISIFNPSNSGKNILLISVVVCCQGGNQTHELKTTTTDPAFGTVVTPVNEMAGGAASVASVTTATTTQTVAGTAYGVVNTSNNSIEFFDNNRCRLLPAGTASGLTVWLEAGTAGTYGVTLFWIEY